MATVSVFCDDGCMHSIECSSIKCPACGALITPVYLSMYRHKVIFCQCPAYQCNSLFLARIEGCDLSLLPNHELSKKSFSNTIKDISKDFVTIYNEAYAAEQMSLNEVCGVGYRKALEYLVKDYISRGKNEDEIRAIREKWLSKCIDDYVTDMRIKEVSKRAVWLGNDETHYVRKWEGKDVHDLKGVIHLVIRWIEQEVETEALLKEMPERQ